MPYLADVFIDNIESVELGESSSTTDHALEDGEEISDHIENAPITIRLSGVILDKTDGKLLKLRNYRQKGEILSFNYRSKLETVVITDFTPSYDATIKDGFRFSMSLKQIRLAKAPNIINVDAFVKQQIATVANAGRKQLQ